MEGRRAVGSVLGALGLPATLLSPLEAHASAVARDSDRLGLVSSGDEALVLQRHTADSLTFALAHRPRPGESWVDVGSGGGFPGLVLAIAYPASRFTLVESNAKKSGFLDLQILDLGLENVEVARVRAADLQDAFDVGTARAVSNPEATFALLRRLVGPQGVAVVAGTGPTPPGARLVRLDLPYVDSPLTLFMMTPA